MDQARSTDPAVQAQLDRLWALSPGADVLGLERITALLAALGNPHHNLPPVFHVAGTNGKGSTCAFLRAGLEAAGYRVHAYTSPHLVRFNERIRLAGTLIDDAALAPLLTEVLDAAEAAQISASFFEITTAAAFLSFARTPADACVIEVGLGGRLDATNVIDAPLVTGIAQLGVDHEAFLGSDPVGIAREKAGIAKRGAPLVTMDYASAINAAFERSAAQAGATLRRLNRDWHWSATITKRRIAVGDGRGDISVPFPRLAGEHQHANLALAVAMMRAQDRLPVSDTPLGRAAEARWPARMQLLGDGPLTALLPPGSSVWLDGGHNAAAADALAAAIADLAEGRPIDIVVGMLASKDAAALVERLAPHARSVTAVPVPDHAHHAPHALVQIALAAGVPIAITADDVAAALREIATRAPFDREPAPVLICGSLYLAGEVLAENDEWPD
ncbi:bifunctional folylpolyglutamate synthase/dihydrofolate synthase [Sphingomonas sp. AX6]|uniref:bifunctional folylpolyglutamate synthase/dihydrofolate synthase n=1 Tax=Sphingomonas sp. AX6 TaxID=2653171 RepID=UPI0012F002F2|nr:folylpolyglutamate synthase/dihydrofolate synthase family protein [Sphingomonas sp. AX6]VXD01202.1 Dihydrofolate synthase [Sphingomonas sp. AX6]